MGPAQPYRQPSSDEEIANPRSLASKGMEIRSPSVKGMDPKMLSRKQQEGKGILSAKSQSC